MSNEIGEQLGAVSPEQSKNQFTEPEKREIELITRKAQEVLSEYGFKKQILCRRRVPEIMLVNEDEGNALSICLLEGRVSIRQGFVLIENAAVNDDRFDHKCTWLSPPPEEQPVDDVTASWWYREYPDLDRESFYGHVFGYVKDNLAGWEGEIVEIRKVAVEREKEGKTYRETIVYAMIQLNGGTIRQENFREFSGWKVGVRLRRQRGCASIGKVRKNRA